MLLPYLIAETDLALQLFCQSLKQKFVYFSRFCILLILTYAVWELSFLFNARLDQYEFLSAIVLESTTYLFTS